MTVSIRIAGAVFEDYLSKPTLPVRAGLVGEFYFGSSESDNLRNWADASKPLSEQGSVTRNAFSASMVTKVAGFYTQHPDTAEHTVFFVGKSNATATALGIMAAGSALVVSGINLFKGDNESLPAYAADGSGAVNFVQNFLAPGDSLANDHIVCSRVSGAVGTPETKWADHWVGGVKKSASLTNDANRVLASGNWGIGYSPLNIFNTGAVLTARAAAIYNRKLSDVEVQEVADFYEAYYAARGITI